MVNCLAIPEASVRTKAEADARELIDMRARFFVAAAQSFLRMRRVFEGTKPDARELMVLLQRVLNKRARFLAAAAQSFLRMRRVFGSTNVDAKEESMVLYWRILSVAIKL